MSVATAILQKEITHMLKYYIKATEALHRLRTDNDGVVSFEYVIVAACIVLVVTAVFSGGGIGNKLNGAIANINLNP
jgi:Flp pilus assembly pilin Flp